MRGDVKNNYEIAEALAAASCAAGTQESAAVDFSKATSASFLVSVGTVGTDATVDAKLQYSADGITWTDEPDETYKNDTAIAQITAAGSAKLHIIYPRARYYRVAVTVATAACVVAVMSVLGPLRHVAPAS